MDKTAKLPFIISAEERESLAIAGGSYTIVVSGKDTGGTYAVIEMLVPPGAGPGPHAHADICETFHVLEGEIELSTEKGKHLAKKGDFVSIPTGGAVHAFRNTSDQLARLWCTVIPAGLEAFFKEIGQPVVYGEFLQSVPPDEEAKRKITEIGVKYGQQFFPPDYFKDSQV